MSSHTFSIISSYIFFFTTLIDISFFSRVPFHDNYHHMCCTFPSFCSCGSLLYLPFHILYSLTSPRPLPRLWLPLPPKNPLQLCFSVFYSRPLTLFEVHYYRKPFPLQIPCRVSLQKDLFFLLQEPVEFMI